MKLNDQIYRIQKIDLTVLKSIPFSQPFYDATQGPFNCIKPAILSVHDSTGHTGIVEFPVNVRYVLENIFVPILLQNKEISYQEIFQLLYWNIRNDGFRGAAAHALGCLDRALYDIVSQRLDQPLHQFLGASRDWVKVYASGGSTHLSQEGLLDECLYYVSQGYTTIKIKAGGDFATHLCEDAERVQMIRNHIGQDIQLAVDTNQVMSVTQAVEFTRQLNGSNISWLEEPLHSADIEGIATLCERTNTIISYGESERSGLVFPTLEKIGVKHLQPVAGHISSIKEWIDVANLAESKDLMFSCGGLPHLNCQLVATRDENAMCEYLMPLLSYLEPLFSICPEFRNGKAFIPDCPGVSVKYNWEKIKKDNLIDYQESWCE